MNDVDFTLRRQTEAAKHLVASIKAQGDDDDLEFVTDSIEGETTLFEAVEAAVAQVDECDVVMIGLKAKEEAFEARRARIGARKERLIALIEQALSATEQPSMKLATCSLSLAKRAPQVVISAEADIPAEFWIEQERPAPKLDKRALAAAIKSGRVVPGASLDNGSISLTIRRK
jgi:Siphovirus Gp157